MSLNCTSKCTNFLLLTCSKKLLIAVHNFVHLNLAIALFVGYLIFAVGMELGAKNEVQGVNLYFVVYFAILPLHF